VAYTCVLARRAVVALAATLLLMGLSIAIPRQAASASPVVAAYLADASVASERAALAARGYQDEGFQMASLAQHCDVPRRCVSRTLMIHRFHTLDADAQTLALLTEVRSLFGGFEPGRVDSVIRLRLVPQTGSAGAFDRDSQTSLAAYQSSATVATRIGALSGLYWSGAARSYLVQEDCGFAGCSARTLVVHELFPRLSPGSSFALLGLVSMDAFGRFERVELVTLEPLTAGT